jgi:hypothetical protein
MFAEANANSAIEYCRDQSTMDTTDRIGHSPSIFNVAETAAWRCHSTTTGTIYQHGYKLQRFYAATHDSAVGEMIAFLPFASN